MSISVAIITGGNLPALEALREQLEGRKIIAADAGYASLFSQWGEALSVDRVVGDCDSISEELLLHAVSQGVEIERHPRDKALSDTELAFELAKGWGAEDIILIGGTGGRFDHSLSNLLYLETEELLSAWYTSAGVGYFLRPSKELRLKLDPETNLSVFALRGYNKAPRIISEGLKWELDGLDWSRACSLSNRNTQAHVTLKAIDGTFLCYVVSE